MSESMSHQGHQDDHPWGCYECKRLRAKLDALELAARDRVREDVRGLESGRGTRGHTLSADGNNGSMKDRVELCLSHVRYAQAPLRIERNHGRTSAKNERALLFLSYAEDLLVRSDLGGDGVDVLLLREVPAMCSKAREWVVRVDILDTKLICANLDAVVELLRPADSDPKSSHDNEKILAMLDVVERELNLEVNPVAVVTGMDLVHGFRSWLEQRPTSLDAFRREVIRMQHRHNPSAHPSACLVCERLLRWIDRAHAPGTDEKMEHSP